MEKKYEILGVDSRKVERRSVCFIYLDTTEDKREINYLLNRELSKKEVRLLDNTKKTKKIVYIEKKDLDEEDNKRVKLGYQLNSSGLGGTSGDTQSPFRIAALLQSIAFGLSSTFMDLGCSSGHILLNLRYSVYKMFGYILYTFCFLTV